MLSDDLEEWDGGVFGEKQVVDKALDNLALRLKTFQKKLSMLIFFY